VCSLPCEKPLILWSSLLPVFLCTTYLSSVWGGKLLLSKKEQKPMLMLAASGSFYTSVLGDSYHLSTT
jgi:hypothetical protein